MNPEKFIYLGSDHNGFELKEEIKKWLIKQKISFYDLGNKKYAPRDDYPDFAKEVAKAVVKTNSLGVLICGSAQGMSIAANKIRGVRAAIPFSLEETALAKEHNDANILCLSGRHTSFRKAIKMIKVFLETHFSQKPRHVRRLNKIKKLERCLK